MSTNSEAPVSQTIKLAYKGIEILLTQRDLEQKVKPFLDQAKAAIDWALENGFELPPQKGFPKKQVDYVEGRNCQKDSGRLIYASTKDGKKFIKCENNKWDKMNNRPMGCQYVEWPKPTYEPTAPEENYGTQNDTGFDG